MRLSSSESWSSSRSGSSHENLASALMPASLPHFAGDCTGWRTRPVPAPRVAGAGTACGSAIGLGLLLRRQGDAQIAQPLDAGDHHVARLEPDLLGLGLDEDRALRRAGEEDVARLERPVLGHVADNRLHVED